MKITFDLETWGSATKPTRSDIEVPKNYKKEEAINRYIDDNIDAAWGKQGLNSLKGEIACIGVAKDDEPVEVLYTKTTEEDLMKRFDAWLIDKGVEELTQIYWIGHNLSGFDIPWIAHRAWKYNLDGLSMMLPVKAYDEHIIDTMLIFMSTSRDPKSKVKLDVLSKYLGYEGKAGMDGSMVHQAFIDGKHKEIAEYCENDVMITRDIVKRLRPWMWKR